MKNRVHNFSAGPATLPLEVLESIREELINYKDIGSSIIEISHRDKTFVEIAEKTEETLRDLLSIPDNYDFLEISLKRSEKMERGEKRSREKGE